MFILLFQPRLTTNWLHGSFREWHNKTARVNKGHPASSKSPSLARAVEEVMSKETDEIQLKFSLQLGNSLKHLAATIPALRRRGDRFNFTKNVRVLFWDFFPINSKNKTEALRQENNGRMWSNRFHLREEEGFYLNGSCCPKRLTTNNQRSRPGMVTIMFKSESPTFNDESKSRPFPCLWLP